MKRILFSIVAGVLVSTIVSCTPSNPSYRYNRQKFVNPKIDDSYMVPGNGWKVTEGSRVGYTGY